MPFLVRKSLQKGYHSTSTLILSSRSRNHKLLSQSIRVELPVLCSPVLVLQVNYSNKLGVNGGLLACTPEGEGLEGGDLAEEASDRLGTVEIIVTLETAIQFVKLCLHTSLVPPSVRLARSPGEVRDLGGGDPPGTENLNVKATLYLFNVI